MDSLPAVREILQTGIPSIDTLLGGGIPKHTSVIVTGEPGTGKTVFCSQIAFSLARRGIPVVVATVTSEPHDKLLTDLGSFGYFDPGRVGDELYVVSAYPALKQGRKEARDLLLGTVRERKAKLLFVDGLRSIRDLWNNEVHVRELLYDLGVGLAASDCVGLYSTEYPLARLMEYPEATTTDGIIALSVTRNGPVRTRRIEVVKLRGRHHVLGEHVFHVESEGVRAVQRIESSIVPDLDFVPSGERAPMGLSELDAMLDGGLPAWSATLLAGSTGVGKTLIGLHFAVEGAQRGENVVFMSFSEPPGRLKARAAAIGLDIDPWLKSGKLQLRYRPAAELEADDVAHEILASVKQVNAARLVIDGLGELEESVLDAARRRGFFAALIVHLRTLKTTTLFIKEIAKLAGPELDFSDTPISVTAENLLFVRHVELRGRLHRIFSILKMRESGFDADVREFTISNEGVKLLGPIRSARSLLTGMASPIHGSYDGDNDGAGTGEQRDQDGGQANGGRT